jgi:hypothetical protein|tara:strand:+ start:371 stop:655 length:285 start_codon:yes stop_codon:yes gene_type:complete
MPMTVNGTIGAVSEHSLVKAAVPFLVAGIIALCTWLFTSVMSLEQQVKLISEGTVHNLEEKVDKLSNKIDAMSITLTDLRVSLGGRDRRDRQDH